MFFFTVKLFKNIITVIHLKDKNRNSSVYNGTIIQVRLAKNH